MKKQRTHKILSVLLSLVMVLSLFSSAVYADEGTGLEAQDASAMGWDSASESSEELTIPAHGMYVTGPGEDGSYTVSLDVTGKSVQKTTVLGKADVVVVLDRSDSMSSKSGFSTRMQVAVKAIDGLAAELLANNTHDNPDAVKMSLVEFSTRASVVTAGETNYTSFMKAVRGAARYPEGGTNWEAALAMANSVPTRPNAAKYVIFISDGDPTFRSSSYGHKDYNMYYHAYGTGDSDPHGWNFAAAIPYAKAIVDYGKQLYFVSGFFSGKMGELAKAAYDGFLPGGRYYSAFDADSLTKAFSDILCEINANSSYKDVVIKDQLTNGMRAVVGAHGVEFTYTKTTYVDGKKITKVWKNAPLAVYNPLTNEVVWNLSAIGTLDASTTYTVSFKVMPEQDLIDYVADVINGVRPWNNEAYNCLIRNLDGTFSLKVAKDARVYFRHLHMVNGQQFVSLMRWAPYANCFIHIGGENYLPWMNLTKIWADNHAADRPEVVTGTILRDGQAWVKVNLSARENYSKRIVTSWNHEYSFEEEETGNYTFSVEPVVAPFAKSYRLVVTNTLATGMISLTVKAEADEGLTPPEATFHYVLTLTDADGNPVAGEFPLFIDGVEVGTIGNGGTIDLQDGQSALIINVPAGTNYKFEQTEVPGFTTTSTGEVGAVPSGDTAAVEFVNHYSAVPAEGLIAVKKVVSGDGTVAIPDITGQYTFTLTAEDGAPLPEETVKTNPDADGGMILFGKIIFEKPGVYNYTVTESGEVDGFVNDSVSTKQVTIVVTDSENGHLAANYSVTIKDPLVFTNYYAQTAASITVRKDLAASFGTIVPSMEGKFTFTLEAVDGAPLPEVTSYTNPCAYGGTMVFGDIVFDQAGVYTYKITETGSADGVTNDAEPVKTVQVVVTENNGKLEAVVNGGKEVVFTNTYQAASVTVPVQVKKAIYHCFEGTHAPDISNAYTFTLATVNGAPLPEKTVMTNPDPDGGVMDFGTVTFTKPGIYIYKVMETGHVDGFINDPTYVKTFVVYVKDNGSGQLEAKITSKEDRTYFLNFYHPTVAVASIPVTKILSAPEGVSTPDITKAFAFVISAASGTPMPEKTTILNPAADGGTAFFSNIRYEEPGTYTYKIKEYGKYRGITNDPVASKVVKVVVTDDGNGALVATVNDGEDVTFVNTYNVTPVKGCIHFSKVITAAEGYQAPDITDQFTFHVEAVNDGPMPNIGTMTNPDADGGDMYFGYFTFTQPGVYKYVIKETGSVPGVTNDPQDKEFEFVVTDNGKGGLDVTCEQDYKIVFVNTYGDFNPKSVEAELKVSKSIIGQEEGDIVPDITGKYTFTVTADEGTPLPERTSVTNPDPDGGVMSFGKVTFTAPGTYSYTFSESGEVEGITNDYVGSRVLTIEVVDDGEGNLKINTNLENPIAFVNIFNHEDTDSASTLICVHKHLYSSVTTSIVPDLTGKYTFTLSAPEGTPMPKVTEVTNPDRLGGSMTFGFVRFTQPGVYHYTVTETGHVPSVANDPVSTREIDAVVERGADGKLTAHMEYHNANGNNEAVIFTNVFAPAALYN